MTVGTLCVFAFVKPKCVSVADLMELTEPELSALADQLDMRPGHQKKMARLLNELRKGSNDDEANHKPHRSHPKLEGQQGQAPQSMPAKSKRKGADLPAGKSFAAFISHKKVNIFVKS